VQGTIFGLTETQITELGMSYAVPGLMLLMLFIVGHLAWQSKAGKFGTMILFLALALGMVGYIAKSLIQYNLGI
jgi:hypothetical protein